MAIKEWLDLFLTVSIIGIALLNYILVKRKRKDELFDKRFEIYKTAGKVYMMGMDHFLALEEKNLGIKECPKYRAFLQSYNLPDFIDEVKFLFDRKTTTKIIFHLMMCDMFLTGNYRPYPENKKNGFGELSLDLWTNIPWIKYLQLTPQSSYWQRFLAWRNDE